MKSLFKMKKLYIHYGVAGILRLFIEKIISMLVYPGSKIIRRPFECRGRRYIKFGSGFTTGRYCRIEAHNYSGEDVTLIIGNNCQINDSVHIASAQKVIIGDNVLIASRVFITDLSHGCYTGKLQSPVDSIVSERPLVTIPVTIADNVWLGEGVVILPGVSLGENCIVGANSVVTKSYPNDVIIAGNPARIIKKYDATQGVWERPINQ